MAFSPVFSCFFSISLINRDLSRRDEGRQMEMKRGGSANDSMRVTCTLESGRQVERRLSSRMKYEEGGKS